MDIYLSIFIRNKHETRTLRFAYRNFIKDMKSLIIFL